MTTFQTNFKVLISCIVAGLLLIPFLGIGQVPVDTVSDGTPISKTTYTSIETFSQSAEWIYGLLIILSGYLSPYIPGLKSIDKKVYRVLAAAVLLGIGFYFGAGSNVFNLFITYAVSTSVYELALKQQTSKKSITS